MTKNLLGLFGLKWNPFLPEIPTEALYVSPRIEHYAFRLEQKVRDGGFALITGLPGLGKSKALHVIAERLGGMRDVTVAVMEHPRMGISDFYRAMGDLFGVSLGQRNRWGGFKALRERWQAHIEATLMRPVLLLDEAQETYDEILAELRILTSASFDSRCLLTTVLCGDQRLAERLGGESLTALGSRIRPRLHLEPASAQELGAFLRHACEKAGNARLMTAELIAVVAEHAAGNYRVACNMAADVLAAGAEREVKQLDEKLYLEVFTLTDRNAGRPRTAAAAAANGPSARRAR
jgi:type II secretory pathway predicted ATPase ExeA